jgi:hypothetical protein
LAFTRACNIVADRVADTNLDSTVADTDTEVVNNREIGVRQSRFVACKATTSMHRKGQAGGPPPHAKPK